MRRGTNTASCSRMADVLVNHPTSPLQPSIPGRQIHDSAWAGPAQRSQVQAAGGDCGGGGLAATEPPKVGSLHHPCPPTTHAVPPPHRSSKKISPRRNFSFSLLNRNTNLINQTPKPIKVESGQRYGLRTSSLFLLTSSNQQNHKKNLKIPPKNPPFTHFHPSSHVPPRLSRDTARVTDPPSTILQRRL